MAAAKFLAALIALLVIVVIVWYFVYGIKLPGGGGISPSSSTTTTGGGGGGNNTTSSTTVPVYYISKCDVLSLLTRYPNNALAAKCGWTGGAIGLWIESGNSATTSLKIVGSDNHTYVNQVSNYQCLTFLENVTLPAQNYTVTVRTGSPIPANAYNSSCQYGGVIINDTLTAPKVVYTYIYNGNFSNAQYTGWNVSGKGFGTAPLNVSYANSNPLSGCYLGRPWTNTPGNYIATTYICGTQASPGNITSSTFYVNKAYLNFRIISPQNNFLYVEVLYNNATKIVAHYNTFNNSLSGGNSTSIFRNATIPLVTVANKPVQIRVVADTQIPNTYIAIGGFTLGNFPHADAGIGANYTFN